MTMPKLLSYQKAVLFTLWLILLICVSTWFYCSALRPSLTGVWDARIAADSNRYMKMGDEIRTGYVEPWIALALAGFPNTLWAPVGLSYLFQTADWLAVFDLTIFVLSVLLLWLTFRISLQSFLPLIFLNATTLVSVLSVNKEILDLFSTALLCFCVKRRLYWIMPLPLVIAMVNRFEFAVILLMFLFLSSASNPLRNHRALCFMLLILSLDIIIPNLNTRAVVDLVQEQKTVSVGGTAVLLNDLQLHYLFLIAYPFKVALTLFGEVFNINKIASYDQLPNDYANTYVLLFNNLANLCIVALIVTRKRFTLHSDVIYLALLISAVSSISGVIQPRYFYMVYVLFCVALSVPPGEGNLDFREPQSRRKTRVRFVFPRIRFSW